MIWKINNINSTDNARATMSTNRLWVVKEPLRNDEDIWATYNQSKSLPSYHYFVVIQWFIDVELALHANSSSLKLIIVELNVSLNYYLTIVNRFIASEIWWLYKTNSTISTYKWNVLYKWNMICIKTKAKERIQVWNMRNIINKYKNYCTKIGLKYEDRVEWKLIMKSFIKNNAWTKRGGLNFEQ